MRSPLPTIAACIAFTACLTIAPGVSAQHQHANGGMATSNDSTKAMGASMTCPMMGGESSQGMKGMQNGQGQGMKGMQNGQGQGMKGMQGGQGGCMMMQGGHGAQADSTGAAMGGGMGNKMGGGMGMRGASDASPQQAYSKSVLSAIEDALQDEYRSEALYERVIEDHGSIKPFTNIVNAERRHSAHLIALLAEHQSLDPDYAIPESKWTAENSPSYASVAEACSASVKGEEDNVALYDRLFAVDLPTDVRSTFEHLRMVSQDRHLPAFQRCAAR